MMMSPLIDKVESIVIFDVLVDFPTVRPVGEPTNAIASKATVESNAPSGESIVIVPDVSNFVL